MPHTHAPKSMKFAVVIVLLSGVYGCTQSNRTEANTTYSCVGEITLNHTDIKCREPHEKFTYFMSLGEKVNMSPEGCSWVHFNYKNMHRTENTDLEISYAYKYKQKDEFFTQTLNVNKMTGAYYFLKTSGDSEEMAAQRERLAISGTCKKTEKVID